MLTQIDHVGIAVTDLDEEVERYRRTFGLEPVHRERMADQGVEEVLFAVGESYVQLLGALGPDTPVGRFLDKRGPGVHHLGYRVANVTEALGRLRAEGADADRRDAASGFAGHDDRVRAPPEHGRGAGRARAGALERPGER